MLAVILCKVDGRRAVLVALDVRGLLFAAVGVVISGRTVPQTLVPHRDVVVPGRESVLTLALLKAKHHSPRQFRETTLSWQQRKLGKLHYLNLGLGKCHNIFRETKQPIFWTNKILNRFIVLMKLYDSVIFRTINKNKTSSISFETCSPSRINGILEPIVRYIGHKTN